MEFFSVNIRKATITDVKEIKKLLDHYAEKKLLLPRSLSDLYENIRDFFVAQDDSTIVGCVALHIVWEDLAEIRSLAVAEERHNQKIGSLLLEAALKEARSMGVKKVFTLTYTPLFFERFGFKKANKKELPHKIWKDCLNCVQFPDCSEEAMIKELNGE
jgi:amino-acid N-acetyltransferase